MVKRVFIEIYVVYCGMCQGCERKECLNFWLKDIVVENCKIICCERKDRDDCLFFLLSDEEIVNYKEGNNGRVNNGNVQVGV